MAVPTVPTLPPLNFQTASSATSGASGTTTFTSGAFNPFGGASASGAIAGLNKWVLIAGAAGVAFYFWKLRK